MSELDGVNLVDFDRVQWTELDDLRVESVGKCEVEWAEPCSKVTLCYISSFCVQNDSWCRWWDHHWGKSSPSQPVFNGGNRANRCLPHPLLPWEATPASYPWYASNDSKRRSPSNSATCPSLLYLRWESNRIKQVDQWSNNLLPSPWIGHFHRCPSWFQASPLDVMPKPAGRQVFWGQGRAALFPCKITQLESL